jgi:hypothetical protein
MYTAYSWEVTLNAGLDVSLGNMWDWKGIREKSVEVNSTNAYVSNDENLRLVSTADHISGND